MAVAVLCHSEGSGDDGVGDGVGEVLVTMNGGGDRRWGRRLMDGWQ
jgi:hypothetical protein